MAPQSREVMPVFEAVYAPVAETIRYPRDTVMFVSAVPPVVPRRGPAVNELSHVPALSPSGPSVPTTPINSSSA